MKNKKSPLERGGSAEGGDGVCKDDFSVVTHPASFGGTPLKRGIKTHILRFWVLVLVGLLSIAPLALAEVLLPTSVPLPESLSSFPTMRVAVLENVDKARLEFSSPYKVMHPVTGDLLAEGINEKDVTVNIARDGIQFGTRMIRASSLRVLAEDETIRVEGKTYRSILRVVKNGKGKLVFINEIPLDDYLKGVLPWEVDPRWHMEALKAQAVAARTFALFQALKNPNAPFFLTSDVKSQVYGGKNSEQLRTSQAVDETRGQVLTYRGRILQAYFHSSCGGRTTRAEAVWQVVPIPPLTGVTCGFCQGSKYDSWTAEFSLAEIEKKLADRGYRLRSISRIEAAERDRSGRIRKVAIHHAGGIYSMRGGDFRVLVGADRMRSTLAAFQNSGGKLLMNGKGWGHGVGLCQWGSKVMAERGFSYENILRFYYPGSQITQAYRAPAEPSPENWFSGWWTKVRGWFGN